MLKWFTATEWPVYYNHQIICHTFKCVNRFRIIPRLEVKQAVQYLKRRFWISAAQKLHKLFLNKSRQTIFRILPFLKLIITNHAVFMVHAFLNTFHSLIETNSQFLRFKMRIAYSDHEIHIEIFQSKLLNPFNFFYYIVYAAAVF